ncbi:MAG: magnesium transporter CorA family protein [Candidatus Peribacter sp.]|jgi:magnesium transporter|nr:magnesium transporter CorA family protein [Candidatus Peribacter sp.]MBT4392772.1 magnesium transporter CorA family protein [Candidatus Peribacter sp.]MBT4600611.1 magnesium transporter CorA family protein [Candidatus Peribacter sp.]MBT5148720.1 magnesium transporter CorA family protein [Candidatus Peribacter sp.]MBT5637685.1 magnesium transporter CorA family protein [Candidatus Peribacter sp.]
MLSLTYKGVSWHDDPAPTEQVLKELQTMYGFHDLDIEDCLSEHERPKVEEYDNYLFLVFHIPYRAKKTGRIIKEEVNIFLGQDFFVTLHRGRIPILDKLWSDLENSEKMREEYLQHGTGFFLYELMRHFFEDVFPLVDSIRKELNRMEEVLFETDEEVDLLKDIMNVKRNIIAMRSILLPQRTLIATLEHKNKKFVPDELALYFDDILDAIERQWALLDTAKEMIDALQDTHESWLSHKTNAVIQVLTIFSVTMLPLTFITGLYGMNVGLPFGAHPNAFFIVLGLMGGILISMLTYFAKKHWL